jgi:hypothetical protein
MATPSRCFENTYAAGPWREIPVPDQAPQWELMLSSLELTEAAARCLLKMPRSRKAEQLRQWITRHYRDRYIPVRFLNREQIDKCRWD